MPELAREPCARWVRRVSHRPSEHLLRCGRQEGFAGGGEVVQGGRVSEDVDIGGGQLVEKQCPHGGDDFCVSSDECCCRAAK